MKKKGRWSDKEIADYYDNQSEEDMIREIESLDWKPVDFVVERTKDWPDSIALPPEIMATVKRLAKKRGVSHRLLVQQWIQERLDQELPRRSRK